MVKAGQALRRIEAAKEEIQRWQKDLKQQQAVAEQRNQLVLFGGQAPAEVRGPAKYEGRRVGMDFFQSPRGPPGDLRVAKDRVPGKHGLAGEYAGNRERENPWEWNALWEEMGIPGETRVALQQEAQADLARGAAQRRVIQDCGVYPAAQGEAMRKEAERLQKEFAIERGKLLAARMQQALVLDEMKNDVLQGRIKWVRENGQWRIQGRLGDDALILKARQGVEILNETPYGNTFSKVLYIVSLYSNDTRALTFENLCQTSTAPRVTGGRSASMKCSRSSGGYVLYLYI